MENSPTEKITVTERDVQYHALICINLERNIWIKRGFPMNTDTGIVDKEVMRNLSGPPYVFLAKELVLVDDRHPQGATLTDVQVIFMHGGRQPGKAWMFSSFEDGYPVVETVNEVNAYLRENGEPSIQVVLSCNFSESADGIQIGDFPPHSGIAYAVGETVGLVSAKMDEDAKISVKAKANSFWGLDDLLVGQQITIKV